MRFNVAQLLKAPVGSRRQYALEAAFEPFEGVGTDWSRGKVSLLRTERGIYVSAEVRTSALCTCSRCLASYQQPLALTLQEEFFPTVDVFTGVALNVPEGTFSIDEHHILDLTEALRQYVVMSVPMKPLCREDCAGICPQCGANRNETPCGCTSLVGDPRWTPLKQLLSLRGSA